MTGPGAGRRAAGIWALAAVLAASPLSAQYLVGVGVDYLGYTFDDGLGATSAQLLMIPVAVRLPATDALTFDVSSAWAEGRIERTGSQLKLSGPVDTGVRAAYQVTPSILVTVGANVPTGSATHDSEEAVVAAVLSTDLLGFRETTWGRGFALTSSVAIARSMGAFGIGLAGAYSLRGAFSPSSDQSDLEYAPGDEARVRLGIDRNFGNSTLTLGGTFINYSGDTYSDAQATDRNLFKAGNRIRFDASYAFRMGPGVWSIYGADLIRQNGERTLTVLDALGDSVGVANDPTPKQNLALAGVIGAVGLGGGFVFRPHVDAKYQTRKDAAGSDAGSGWVVAAGGDLPIRVFGGYDFFPQARVLMGSIKNDTGASVGLFGLEFTGTIRGSF
jgi:hypothetical protein